MSDGFGVQKDTCICPNDNVLYKDEFDALKVCPTCGLAWLKKKLDRSNDEEDIEGPPAKVLWYLPIIPRFKLLFSIKKGVKNLTWLANGRKCDNLLQHLANSP